MLARFFIDRPVFAWVISIVIVLVGLMAMIALPVAQYPEITPPTIQVSAVYPAPAPRSWPTPWPRPSSSRSTASKT